MVGSSCRAGSCFEARIRSLVRAKLAFAILAIGRVLGTGGDRMAVRLACMRTGLRSQGENLLYAFEGLLIIVAKARFAASAGSSSS